MIALQDFLIVCNHLEKLQMIQDQLNSQVIKLFEEQLQMRSSDSEQMSSRPRSFPFAPRLYSEDIAQTMWAAGTNKRNFTGAIFCDLFDGYKLRDTDQIPKLCEEFLFRYPKCKVNFHFDPDRKSLNHFKLEISTASNLNVFPTTEPDKIVRDLMEQINPIKVIVTPRHIAKEIPGFPVFAR